MNGARMDLTAALTEVEAALTHQIALAGGEDALGVDGEVLFAAMAPALRHMGLAIAEQAAAEVRAQLPEHDVDLLVADGEPSLRIRRGDGEDAAFDQLDARLTLRLPESLKRVVEQEAGELGDSVNTFVLKTLSSQAGSPRRRGGAAQRGEFHT